MNFDVKCASFLHIKHTRRALYNVCEEHKAHRLLTTNTSTQTHAQDANAEK
jgi:hypothetical protein